MLARSSSAGRVAAEACTVVTKTASELPSQNRFSCGNLVFFSDFDSGNLANLEVARTSLGNEEIRLWTAPDCAGTPFETALTTWFYFGISGARRGQTVDLAVMNLNNQGKLFASGLRPVVCVKSLLDGSILVAWRRSQFACSYSSPKDKQQNQDGGDDDDDGGGPDENAAAQGQPAAAQARLPPSFQVRWRFVFGPDAVGPDRAVFFAFSFPYSLSEIYSFTGEIQQLASSHKRWCERSVLTRSAEGREVPLVKIHAADPAATGCRRAVVVSARVHPGETPASHMFEGFLRFLLQDGPETCDPRAEILLQHFVFYCIPCLNPDGVYRGHYRTDSFGTNLNRAYSEPDAVRQPTIHAILQLLIGLHRKQSVTDGAVSAPAQSGERGSELFMFLDMHAHANKRNCFVYGNYFEDADSMVESLLFAKLMAMNDPNFDFAGSNFSAKAMKTKDRRDGASKENCGRVCLHRQTMLPRIYTLEVNYATGRCLNSVLPLPPFTTATSTPTAAATATSASGEQSRCIANLRKDPVYSSIPRYDIEVFRNTGTQAAVSLLDLVGGLNPFSRVLSSEQKTLSGLKESLRQWIASPAGMKAMKIAADSQAGETRQSAVGVPQILFVLKGRATTTAGTTATAATITTTATTATAAASTTITTARRQPLGPKTVFIASPGSSNPALRNNPSH